jgi:autocrine motility factor receptor
VSWLPSFSVEVTHTQILGNAHPPSPPVQTSQLDNMARQVHDVFPNMALSSILEDLQVTHSVEMTIENILMGNVTSPPSFSGRNGSNLLSDSISSQNEPAASVSLNGDSLPSPDEEPTACAIYSDDEVSTTPELLSEENIAQGLEEQASNINFIQHDNLPDLTLTNEVDDIHEQVPNMSGSRFSKSPKEREAMLTMRKNSLMEHARKKYLSKIPEPGDNPSSESEDSWPSQSRSTLDFPENHTSANESQDNQLDIQRRRELAFQAAQRRLRQTDT